MEAHNLVSTLLHLRRFQIKNFCSKVSLESKMLLGFEDDPYYGPHILDNILMICISTLFSQLIICIIIFPSLYSKTDPYLSSAF